MVSRIVAVSIPQLWDNAEASVLLSAIGVCRIDSRSEGLEKRSMTSSYALLRTASAVAVTKGTVRGAPSVIAAACIRLLVAWNPMVA